MSSDSNIYNSIISVLSEKSGVEVDEINEETFFEDDLNIGEIELVEILTEFEDQFKVELVESKDDIETVQDLIDLVSEQIE